MIVSYQTETKVDPLRFAIDRTLGLLDVGPKSLDPAATRLFGHWWAVVALTYTVVRSVQFRLNYGGARVQHGLSVEPNG